MAKKKQPVQMAQADRTEGWFDGKKVIPFHEMESSHILSAIEHAEKQEFRYFKLCGTFGKLVEQLVEEAERRHLNVRHINTEFTYNTHGKKRNT